LAYDTNGYLTQVSGPVPGATTTFTYDGYGRRRTTTDPTGLTLTYDYDALDRVTQVSYPDGTSEQTTYNRLDAEGRRDRLGRWSRVLHDALRRVVATRDPAAGTTQYQYGGSGCLSCGGSDAQGSGAKSGGTRCAECAVAIPLTGSSSTRVGDDHIRHRMRLGVIV